MSWTALFWREYREHMRPAGRMSGQLVMALAMAVLFGAGAAVLTGLGMRSLGPWLPGAGVHWHAASALAAGTAAAAFMAIVVPLNLGIDAVAGERERHTLATLATTPLSDGQIVWAKSAAITLAACTVAAAGGLAVWVALVILYGGVGLLWGGLAVPGTVVATVLPSYLLTTMAMALSTRAKTVKDAGQRMAFVMMPLFFLYPALSMAFLLDPVPRLVVLITFPTVVGLGMLLGPVLAFVRFRRESLLTA